MTPAYEAPREGVRLADRYTLTTPSLDRGLGDAWGARDARANGVERLVKFHPLGGATEGDARALVARLREVSAPGIAVVLDGGVWEGRLYLVHEPCAGRSLQHWLDGWRTTLTPPTQGTLKVLFLALCSALHEAHGKGLAHERLNPRSVVITSVKSPKPLVLVDCGVAAFLSGDAQAACVNYLSPEQLDRPKKGASSDPKRADLFALGVILAELLTLRATPKVGTRETWEQLVRANPRKSLASLMPRPEDTPDAVWALVEGLLLNRGDAELANGSKIRQTARKAWESGGVRDESPDSLREAPLPVAQPAGARASGVTARESSPATDRREGPPTREPRLEPAAPSAPAVAPPRPPVAHAVVAVAPSRPAPPEPRLVLAQRPAYDDAPILAEPAKPRMPAVRDAGADTLVDFEDDDATAVSSAKAVRAAAPRPFAPFAPPQPDAGGDTLSMGDAWPAHGTPPRGLVGDASETLLLDPPSARPIDDDSPLTMPLVPFVSPSDAFGIPRKRGGDTLSIDDERSPLVAAIPRGRPSHPSAATIDMAPAPREVEAVRARRLPDPSSDTLPIDGGPVGHALIVSSGAAPAVWRGLPPEASPAAGDHAPSSRSPGGAPSPWNAQFVIVVVLTGVVLGVLIVALLRRG